MCFGTKKLMRAWIRLFGEGILGSGLHFPGVLKMGLLGNKSHDRLGLMTKQISQCDFETFTFSSWCPSCSWKADATPEFGY